MTKIFINYRRLDTQWQALLLYSEFSKVVSEENLFMDVESLKAGQKFPDILKKWVEECDIFLALIGNGWINATSAKTGKRRLEEEDDFVRTEICRALERDIRVVPVMLEDAPVPDASDLPDDLKDLFQWQIRRVELRTFKHDVDRLIAELDLGQELAPVSNKPLVRTRFANIIEFNFSKAFKNLSPLNKTILIKTAKTHGTHDCEFLPGGGLIAWFQDIDHGPEMVVIPEWQPKVEGEGIFVPKLEVGTRPFAVSRHEVTFDQWDAAYHAGGVSNAAEDEGWGRGCRPVINVSWHDAVEYTNWLSEQTGHTYRLLSEAEWEYCCRAGKTAMYSGRKIDLRKHAHYLDLDVDNELGVQKVGQLEPNSFGLFDMLGNAWEWCHDSWRENTPEPFTSGIAWDDHRTSRRAARGGGWSSDMETIVSLSREGYAADRGRRYIGFRVARLIK